MDIIPPDTRYVPIQQQPYLCCPTSIQMVMARHNLPLLAAEFIGWHLGLVVPPHDAQYFYNPRTSEEEPSHGYGTQVGSGSIDPDQAFKDMGVPFRMEFLLVDEFESPQALVDKLGALLAADLDVLMCVRWFELFDAQNIVGPADPNTGHVVVVDRVEGDMIHIVDPARGPKWKDYAAELIFTAMQKHDRSRAPGLWVLHRTDR